ncbi:uncharacterized protein LOC111273843 isoform X1 [Varroa jacobsoni]|uniref:CIDE-N domain-containing protein n=1 Tax=Varroa destructor TaxID=109461 RepID=A0A7M7KMX1_VARDE|nr:uncharacterized protein LOC111253260 isoform X2 [Varroa destructor]XP_022668148.1 uncharacterized protein LOC111253260 isoform X2 [Varroa destructor]XP_022668149.1 uncharacterized protein LOC111253260 isoform X2 [Varroa destructor]XP_022711564.1 uncharacterized protein LOC111273843 isoform X1 [Varroa jacobsoni]XP_022711565.1 uncharacterized protein LOC111273843 isoform X1 [Varroa jacobsoni]XP_022711566.1 uncharacterized protein LOC111273843 isoform X1 [Varroa jacobsoni]XP_022711567.1 uncha
MAEGALGSRRLFKVWSADRRIRKAVMATTLAELIDAGCTKLGYTHQVHRSDVRVVLEADGTHVEDEQTFGSLLRDTVLLLMLPGQAWLPPSVEAIKTAINAIPQIVCETMRSLDIVDIAPSWKIMEHRGKVTVVLTWEPQDRRSRTPEVKIEVLPDSIVLPGRGLASGQSGSRPSTASSGRNKSPQPPGLQCLQPVLGLSGITGAGRETDRDTALATLPGPGPSAGTAAAAAATSSDATTRHDRGGDRRDKKSKHGEKHGDKHTHAECDFHCSSLHQQQHKAAATSPIVDFPEMAFGPPGVFGHGGGGMPLPQSKSVHFEAAAAAASSVATGSGAGGGGDDGGGGGGVVIAIDTPAVAAGTRPESTVATAAPANNDTESESQQEDDEELADRYLLLVDQLAVDQDKHLTIKDIGVILERLSSKIVDVERLEREKETKDIHNWTIKATLRGGHVLSEVGVVYNGRYYGVIEHPGYF